MSLGTGWRPASYWAGIITDLESARAEARARQDAFARHTVDLRAFDRQRLKAAGLSADDPALKEKAE